MAAAATPSRPAPRGDEETLYRTHNHRLLDLVARDVTARRQVIEDACAYAWAELLARQPERTSIVGWLRVVARHEGIRLVQVDRATVSLSGVAEDSALTAVWSTGRPTTTHEQYRAALEALAALAELPERKRTFLTLKVAGYTYDEIAEQLGTTCRTVDRQLARARAAVRATRAADAGRR
jgi:RNA polymerase sigma factor (sigma-70 family)